MSSFVSGRDFSSGRDSPAVVTGAHGDLLASNRDNGDICCHPVPVRPSTWPPAPRSPAALRQPSHCMTAPTPVRQPTASSYTRLVSRRSPRALKVLTGLSGRTVRSVYATGDATRASGPGNARRERFGQFLLTKSLRGLFSKRVRNARGPREREPRDLDAIHGQAIRLALDADLGLVPHPWPSCRHRGALSKWDCRSPLPRLALVLL